MTWAGIRIGIGTRVTYDGEVHVVNGVLPTVQGTDVVLRGPTSVCRVSLVELVSGRRARLLTDIAGPEPDDGIDPAAVVLGSLSARGLKEVRERAAHLREVLTGFRSGSSEAAGPGEPRAQFDPSKPLLDRYAAKAAELGVAPRTIRRWAAAYRQRGEAGLASARFPHASQVDPRWSEAALCIMREHTEESKPSEKAVIYQTSKRLEICFGHGVVPEPARATAYRELKRLEARHRTFTGTTARNRDIATRPKRPYGKLQRPPVTSEFRVVGPELGCAPARHDVSAIITTMQHDALVEYVGGLHELNPTTPVRTQCRASGSDWPDRRGSSRMTSVSVSYSQLKCRADVVYDTKLGNGSFDTPSQR
jgi:hypothetical protein